MLYLKIKLKTETSLQKNGYGSLKNFNLFDPKNTSLKLYDPQQISIFKILFNTIITLILLFEVTSNFFQG